MTALDVASLGRRPGFRRLLETLGANQGETRLVGGVVRDSLLGLPVADVDLATRLTPPQVIEALEAADIRAVPTGLQHGTVTAVVGGAPYEVTTLRRDVQTFGRHAEVAFTDAWAEDAARRDFTMNALYADPLTGELFDYFDGIADLAAHRVRFIGDPFQRIAEDHLRILRFFRFTARFATTPDEPALAACTARANDLMALSRERIRDELLKLLALPSPAPTVAVMLDRAILRPVLPEIDDAALPGLRGLIQSEADAKAEPNPLRRLAAMLPADAAVADLIAARLKLSNADRAQLVQGASREAVPKDPRTLAYRIGADAATDRLLLTADPRAAVWLGQLRTWQRPRMPISGKDLIAMGLIPGPAVSRRLAEVEARWLDRGFPADRDRVLAIAREVLGLV